MRVILSTTANQAMPSAASVRKDFNLVQGQEFGGFTISKVKMEHVVEAQNEKYSFPLKIWLRATKPVTNAEEEARAALVAHIGGEKLIYSEYGSPYRCEFHGLKVVGHAKSAGDKDDNDDDEDGSGESKAGVEVQISGKGLAVRRRDIPTLTQLHKANAPASEQLSAADKARLSGHRLLTSHFGSGKCAVCGGGIAIGAKIAKDKGAAGKGGWAHVRCELQRLGGGSGGGGAGAAGDAPESAASGTEESKKQPRSKKGSSKKAKATAKSTKARAGSTAASEAPETETAAAKSRKRKAPPAANAPVQDSEEGAAKLPPRKRRRMSK